MRKLLSTFVAVLFSGAIAFALGVPQVPSSPTYSEPNQIVPTLNYLVGLINANRAGLNIGLQAVATTSGTSANTVLATTVPAGTFGVSQVWRIRGWGTNSADANAKTITVNFGTSAPTVVVTGSGNKWSFDCDIQNVGTTASPSQNINCKGITDTTNIATVTTNSTQALTADLALNVQMTAATAGTMTMNGLTIENVR